MGKNILKKVKISIIAVITGLSCTIVPNTFDVQAAVEGGTDIWLKLEKKTVDIDDIPDNGLIKLDLYIENNTKIDGISFYTEIDDRLEYWCDYLDGTEGVVSGSAHGLWDEPQRKLYTEVFFIDDMYEYSGVLGQLKVRLPEKEKIRVGDTYQINFVNWNIYEEPCIGILEPEVKILEGVEYFGGFEGGEIVITGDNPEPVQNTPESSNNHEEQSTPPEQQQNNEQPQSENSNENNTAQPQTESVTTPVTTVSQVTTSITTVITTVKETKATTVSTVPATVAEETESITGTENTDAVINKSKEESNNNSNNKIKIIIFVVAIVVLTSVSAVAIRKKK